MRAFLPAFVVLLLAGCSTLQQAIAPPPPDPKTLMPALEQRIAILIADQRSRIDPDAKPLMIDPELSDIARKRAQDMAAKNYMAHTAPSGDTSATLLMAEDAQFQGLLGENIAAQHYTPALGVDVETFAHRFVDGWLASPPHKENLSFADYNRTGVGAAVNGDTVYVTQLFATDLGLGPHLDKTPPLVVTPMPSPSAARDAMPRSKPAELRGSTGSQ
ncbi:MAG TPA: CAP domain-containing protein [Rhizomicrobium sp.]|nr:CAP domain-containing protein [Rhizomicrobium sp.]